MLGEELRRRREDLGISLLEISESTRIGTRFLKAIETDNFSALPGGIFTRSFIRAYAKRVGMDEDEAVTMYQEESGTTDRPVSDPPPGDPEPVQYLSNEEPSHGLLSTALVAVAAALVLVTGGWAVYHYLNKPMVAEVSAATIPEAQPAPPQPAQPAPPPPAPSNLNLTLLAKGTCWIKYTSDAGEPTQVTLKEGESRTIKAESSIDLTIGNTQAVSMKLNDRDAHFPANTPIVLKKFTINRDNANGLLD